MSEPILRTIANAISAFEAGHGDIAGLQLALEANAAALDSSYALLVDELRAVDADLEEIRFTVSRETQRDAAIERLSGVRRLLDESSTDS